MNPSTKITRMHSRVFLLIAVFLVSCSLPTTHGFNSNLPPPWLAHSTTIKPIPTRSAAKSRPKKESTNKSSPQDIAESSNSGSRASTEPETSNSRGSDATEDKTILEHDSDSSTKSDDVEEIEVTAKEPVTYGAAPTTFTTVPSFGVSGQLASPPATQSSVQKQAKVVNPAVRPYLTSLLKMCRLSNIPGVIALHVIGAYTAIRNTGSQLLLSTMMQPSMLMVLASQVVLTCSSMVVNDYYDARTGVDVLNAKNSFSVPPIVIKRFLSYLYASLLIGVVFLPGKIARMSVVSAAMLTFWYTQHLKPKTWIKNVSVSGIIALSPITSAAAASYVLDLPFSKTLANVFPLSMTIFLFAMGREIWMDILDETGDREANVETVPVRYGKRFASRAVLGLDIFMGLICVGGPLLSFLSGESVGMNLTLRAIGLSMVLVRAVEIVRRDGTNTKLIQKAVEEGKIALLLLTACL